MVDEVGGLEGIGARDRREELNEVLETVTFNPDIHHRRSVRLRDYDYSSAGAYFVTICTFQRECLFGEVVDGVMRLNEAGKMIQAIWEAVPHRFAAVETDQNVVMPNHFHGILLFTRRGESCIRPESSIRPGYSINNHKDQGDHKDRPYGTMANSLGRVIQAFKSLTTHGYVAGVASGGWPSFPGRLWQRNYHEHIIRNEHDLMNIRRYIAENPLQWDLDENNPANVAS